MRGSYFLLKIVWVHFSRLIMLVVSCGGRTWVRSTHTCTDKSSFSGFFCLIYLFLGSTSSESRPLCAACVLCLLTLLICVVANTG